MEQTENRQDELMTEQTNSGIGTVWIYENQSADQATGIWGNDIRTGTGNTINAWASGVESRSGADSWMNGNTGDVSAKAAFETTIPPKKHPFLKAAGCAAIFGVIAGGMIIASFAAGRAMFGGIDTQNSRYRAEQESEAIFTQSDAGTTTTEALQLQAGGSENGEEQFYTVREIAEYCTPSIVAITNEGISEVQSFFGTSQYESTSAGSGVIIEQSETELLIATNYHVVQDAITLTVCFEDSEEYAFEAVVKGYDVRNDLAVVVVQLADLPAELLSRLRIATVGDSDALFVGDQVVAIGNALGYGQSVTSGYISALGREVTIDGNTAYLLQTDAAINPGNSGGALFNMRGELIGINSAKFADTDVEGMGFAIPVNTAKPILAAIMERETRLRLESGSGYLGITGSTVSPEATLYGVPLGVYVLEVMEGSAAERAGIQEEDIITGLDGLSITSIQELKEKLLYYHAGETVEITVQRMNSGGYEEIDLRITLDENPETAVGSTPDQEPYEDRDWNDDLFNPFNGLEDFFRQW